MAVYKSTENWQLGSNNNGVFKASLPVQEDVDWTLCQRVQT